MLVGANPSLRPSHVWSIRTKLQIDDKMRDMALFNLAVDSKLRGCDVAAVRVDDVALGGYAADRATIRQKKTGRPVRFELTDQTGALLITSNRRDLSRSSARASWSASLRDLVLHPEKR